MFKGDENICTAQGLKILFIIFFADSYGTYGRLFIVETGI